MTTRLDIIRHMLSVVGESGVSTEDSLHPSVLTATGILNTEDLDFQGPGWWFNTERKLKLVKDNRGEVNLPANTLSMQLSNIEYLPPDDKVRYVKRGARVYDNVKHTFALNQDLTVDLITQLEVEDVPAVAASYLMHKSAYVMYVNDDGDQFKSEKLEQRANTAWQKLRALEMKVTGANALDSPTARRIHSRGMGGSYNPNLIGGRYG